MHDLLAALRVAEAVEWVLLNCDLGAEICPQGRGLNNWLTAAEAFSALKVNSVFVKMLRQPVDTQGRQ